MKDTNRSFLKVVLAYCLIIGLVLLWSGNKKEKTIFDKYLISFRGLSIACDNLELSSTFFKEVLEFKEERLNSNLFILPDTNSIALLDGKNLPNPNLAIRLRVKNGIYKLHDRLEKRVLSFFKDHQKGEISKYEKSETDVHFSITDPSGIKIIFYQSRAFSKGL